MSFKRSKVELSTSSPHKIALHRFLRSRFEKHQILYLGGISPVLQVKQSEDIQTPLIIVNYISSADGKQKLSTL